MTNHQTKCSTAAKAVSRRTRILVYFAFFVMALASCATPQSYYPKAGFVVGSIPPNEVHRVQVYLKEDAPRCNVREIATLRYDGLSDGVFTSQDAAIASIRQQAADLGAHGVYRFLFTPVGFSSAATEYSGQATAYVCLANPPQDKQATPQHHDIHMRNHSQAKEKVRHALAAQVQKSRARELSTGPLADLPPGSAARQLSGAKLAAVGQGNFPLSLAGEAQGVATEPPSSGGGLIIAGSVLMGDGVLNLLASPTCLLLLNKSSNSIGPCLGAVGAISALQIIAGIPMLVVGSARRARYRTWQRANAATFAFGPGASSISVTGQF